MYLQLVDCAHFILLAFRWLPVQTHRPPPFYIYIYNFFCLHTEKQTKEANERSVSSDGEKKEEPPKTQLVGRENHWKYGSSWMRSRAEKM